MTGITSYGFYIPRLRLERMAIFQAMGWFAPAIFSVAPGGTPQFPKADLCVNPACGQMTHNLGGFPHQNVCAISIIGPYGK